jgi:integrase
MLTKNAVGIWQVDITVAMDRVRKSTRTKDKAVANKIHAQIEKEMLLGRWLGSKHTLESAMTKALADHWAGMKSSHRVDANWILIKATMKNLPGIHPEMSVADFGAEQVSTLIGAFKKEGLSPATINRRLALIRKLLNLCVDWQWIATMPRVKVLSEPNSRHRELTKDEEVSMMRFFADKYPLYAGLFEYQLSSACRISDSLKLEWKYVNFDKRTVKLMNTKSGEDVVKPMTDVMYRVLEASRGLDRPFPFTIHSVSWVWSQFRKEMNLQDDGGFVIHGLRHTCASRLAAAGVDLMRIRDWLYQLSYQTTLGYTQLQSGHLSDVVGVLDGI